MNKKLFNFENLTVSFLIFLGIIIRILSDKDIIQLLPNFAPIGALALFSGVYLRKKYALVIPLVAMVVSDIFIGWHNLVLFTWGSFALICVIGWWVRKRKNIFTIIGGSLTGSILFFLITNLAVWAFTPLYTKTAVGLVQCFTMAIPFFRNTILGDLFFVGVFFGLYELLTYWVKKRQPFFILTPHRQASKLYDLDLKSRKSKRIDNL